MTVKKSNPIVSVVMAVYNGERFLADAITSILAQTFTDFEFVIINDGSSDRSRVIIEEYAQQDKRLIVINQENKGLTASLNRGLAVAQGRYIARQDADDISLPERFAKQVAFLDKNPDYGLVGTRYDEIDDTGAVSGPQRVRFVSDNDEIQKVLMRYNPFFHSSVMFRRGIIDTVGMYDELFRFAQDYEYWMRICPRYNTCNIPEVLAFRRNSPGMISAARRKEQLGYSIRSKLKHYGRLRLIDTVSLCKDIVRLMIV